ncbi:MAG TPA: hypothetical protein VEJ43_15920 [Pseudolabrys sp.]|nr:hypothetical protein [Pseudolabrys sp.]
MFLARQSAVAKASVLLTSAFFALVLSAENSRAKGPPGACEDAADLAVLTAPFAPWKGAPLRVIFAAENSADGELSLIAPDGHVAAKSREQRGGPPYFWLTEVASPAVGTWRATLARSGCGTVTREIAVRGEKSATLSAAPGTVWPLRNTWNRATENLYSAWIEKLFDSPLDTLPSWPALHQVLRDRSRNVLFDYLGMGEDEMGLIFRPDCADLPYFLRAYFAFKMGLPAGYSKCSRGGGGQPPKCPQWFSIQSADASRSATPEQKITTGGPTAKPAGLAASFGQYIRTTGDAVHSGSGRTWAGDDNTDYYPVPLTQDELRPGVVYADPYGHVLVLARRVPQTSDGAGVFIAVDAQPDGTVTLKRFWRGNFLFARDRALGSAGFKRFRPIVREANGSLHRLTNNEIAQNAQYADFSMEQTKLGVEDFYDRMDDVMSPEPLDPLRAMKEAIIALDEQVKARITSVENGRKYQNSGRGEAAMPDGAAIFETTGAWEDFATPSRDLRLLIAIDVVRGFPDRVARLPQRYAMPQGRSVADVKAELDRVLASELSTRKFSYPRSDGSTWQLSLKDVIDRAGALEMAYNVNDCVELRWGAQENSNEASTCKRHAPGAQRAKMTQYRPWFHERRRPPRA